MYRCLLALILLCTPLGAQPTPVDAPTLELLNQGREDDSLLAPEQVRQLKPKSFPEATVIGYVVGSNDCIVGTILVEGRVCGVAEGSARVLRKRGWEKATADERVRLARLWLEEVQLGFGDTMMVARVDGFPPKTPFLPPEMAPMLSGAVRVVTWVQEPPGASMQRVFRKNLFWFSREGALAQVRVLERIQGE